MYTLFSIQVSTINFFLCYGFHNFILYRFLRMCFLSSAIELKCLHPSFQNEIWQRYQRQHQEFNLMMPLQMLNCRYLLDTDKTWFTEMHWGLSPVRLFANNMA